MATLEQLRAAYPDAQSDEQAMQMLATESGIDARLIANKFGYDNGQGGLNAERASGSGANFRGSMYGVAEAGADAAGLPQAGEWARRRRQNNEFQAKVAGSRAHEAGAVDDWRAIRGPGDAANYAAGLAYSTAPQMAAMAAGGVAGGLVAGPAGAVAGAALAGYPINVGQVLDNQREQADGKTDLLSAAALGVPYTAIDTMTGVGGKVVRALRPASKAAEQVVEKGADGIFRRVAKEGAKTALEEGAGEVAQTGLEQAGRMAVDPNESFYNDQSSKRFVDAGVGGAVLGGLVGGVSGVRGHRAAASPPVNDAPGSSTDILATAPAWTTAQGFEPAPPGAPAAPNPLGDTAPEWTTSRGFEPRQPGMDAAGMYPAVGDPSVSTGTRRPALDIPAVSGRPDLPDTMIAGGPGSQVAGSDAANTAMMDPGAIAARDNSLQQKLEIERAAQQFAARKQAAHEALVDNDANGQPLIQLKPKDLMLHNDLVGLLAEGKISQEQYNQATGIIKESLRSDDTKSINQVRKEIEEIKNPKPVAPATAPAAEKAPIVAEKAAAPAPKPLEAPAAAPAAAPVATPKVTDYAAYEGRSVAVEVPVEGRKPIRRVVKNAGAALKEADERASKFEELARCLGHVAA